MKWSALFVCFVCQLTVASAAELSPQIAQEIERLVTAEMNRQGIPGLTIAVARQNELCYSRGFGVSDVENLVPTRPRTAFRTASIAKPMTAVAALRLVEQNRFDLDKPVREYLPEFPEKRWPVLPRALLGHLAGIRHYKHSNEAVGKASYPDVKSALSIFWEEPLLHEPGTKFRYTTFGYNLLGAALEEASSQQFMQLLDTSVFTPAEMERTRSDDHFAIIENRSRGYVRVSSERRQRITALRDHPVGSLINAELHDTSMKIPGGGLVSTAPDLIRFLIALNTEKILTPSSLSVMWTRQKTIEGEETDYGLGWQIGELVGQKKVSHGGGQAGTATHMMLLPGSGDAVAIMTNLQGARLKQLSEAVLRRTAAVLENEQSAVDYGPAIRHLRTVIQAEVQSKQLPGFSISLVDDDEVVWAEGFGWQDQAQTIPATGNSIYRVGSISKLLTDFAVMQLVEQGALDLDEDVRMYVPDFSPLESSDEITLRQLMSHRSGLVRESPVGNYFDPTEPGLAETIKSLNEVKLIYPPGEKTKYSNAAVALAGYALERAAGRPFSEHLRETVLEPLEMSSSDFRPLPEFKPHLAEGWMWTHDGRRFAAPEFSLGTLPAGNLYASVQDLGHLLSMVFQDGRRGDRQILKQDTIRSMLRASPGSQRYGIGFRLSKFDGQPAFGHGGAVYGFSTQLKGLVQAKLGVAAVASLDGVNGTVGRLADYALRVLDAHKEGKEYPVFERSAPIAPELARRSVGTYHLGDQQLEIRELAGRAWLRRGSQLRELRMIGDTFVVDDVAGFGPRVKAVAPDQLEIEGKQWSRVAAARPAAAPERWQGLIGEYGWDHNTLYIYEDRGQLVALIEWFYYYPLKEVSEDVFAFPDYGLYHGEKLVFHRQEGTATAVVAASVEFKRRPTMAAGATFKITPQYPIAKLRASAATAGPPKEDKPRPAELVELSSLDPTIKLDIRYATDNNFMGSIFYDQPRAFMQKPAAEALVRVHRRLAEQGLGLMIHDAYRPWYVTKMFWDATPGNLKHFVANPAKGSRHNRGCAVDLTLYDLRTGEPIEMVAGYDEFSERAYPRYPGGTSLQRWYRELLRASMEREGFSIYEFEWWHFDYQAWDQYPILNVTFDQIGP